MATFSIIWISDKFSVFLENEKYGYCEVAEKNGIESENETKLKTLFFDQTDFFNWEPFSLTDSQNYTSFYSFNVKEFCFEDQTPPPEKV